MDSVDNVSKRPRGRPRGPSGKYIVDGKPVFEEEYQLWKMKQKYGPDYDTTRGRPKVPSGKYVINGKPVYEDDFWKLAPGVVMTEEKRNERKTFVKRILEENPEVKVQLDIINEYKKTLIPLNLDYLHFSQRVSTFIRRKKEEEKVKMKARWKGIGVIIPKGAVCEVCEMAHAVQRHHPDYNKPLDVIFVCRQCHKLLDIIQQKTNNLVKD